MHANRKSMAKGFTLVEILIVVVILGILAAIVVPQFTNAANEARTGNVATQVSTIENQLELWAARNGGSYPDLATAGETWQDLVDDGFFKEIPVNPFSGTSTISAWDSTGVGASSVLYDDSTGWNYDAATGNIAAGAPASAAP
jgi:general secretion pathway protein G